MPGGFDGTDIESAEESPQCGDLMQTGRQGGMYSTVQGFK